MSYPGCFVTLEGVEGSGKTTLRDNVVAWARQTGLAVRLTREPGGTRFGERVRAILLDADGPARCPEAELLLYLADRVQDIRENIVPALSRGDLVLCDRYQDATVAYQGHARGLDRQWISSLAQGLGLLSPDLTLLLDADPALTLPRAIRRNEAGKLDREEGRFEAESLAFHRRVREGYLRLAAAEPRRFFVIDAMLPAEEVFRQAKERLVSELQMCKS